MILVNMESDTKNATSDSSQIFLLDVICKETFSHVTKLNVSSTDFLNDSGDIWQQTNPHFFNNCNDTMTTQSHQNVSNPVPHQNVSTITITLLSVLFCIIAIVGIFGNSIVIYAIVSDVKMRRSVTNLFILNLALADLAIILFGIPEIVQFILDRGWILGLVTCKVDRYILVTSLYTSITTLMAVCIERYIAIVHPIQAHIWCSRRRTLAAICCIWPSAMVFGLPTVLFNDVVQPFPGAPIKICRIVFPTPHVLYMTVYKLIEFVMFFLGPIVVQIVMYSIISKHLFIGTNTLHRKKLTKLDGIQKLKDVETVRIRKGVVKMLISTVIVYFISYAPVQIPLFYNIFSKIGPFQQKWPFLVLVMTLGYINSACNPILYSIFSQKFRKKFVQVFYKVLGKQIEEESSEHRNRFMALGSSNTQATFRPATCTVGRYTHFHVTSSTST